jgi:glycosyltransferase involved in cell wall biosynthesis
MKNPKVSIITPTYNGEKFIERAIKSVLWQTFKDWEMIIVDDGSKDNTVEIVKKYVEQDLRIKLIELKENTGGPAIPRTIACKEAKGDYIAFLDQDDLYYPEYLELKIKYLDENPKVTILYSLAWSFDENNKKIINVEWGGPVNMIVRKRVLEIAEYFKQNQNNADDAGMIHRYFLRENNGLEGAQILTQQPMTLYSRHPSQGSYIENKDLRIIIKKINSLINEYNKELEERQRNEKTYDENYFKLKKYFNIANITWYSRLGNLYCLLGKMREGREAFKKSLSFGFNWFSFSLLILSYLGHKPYRKIEYFLRQVQRKIFWRLKVLIYRLRYPQSYKKAIEILNKLG